MPVVNLLAFGYLMEYAFRARATRDLELPEWNELGWRELLVRGLCFGAILVVLFFLPLLLGWVLSELLGLLTFGLLGYFAYAPLALTALVAPALFLSSLQLYVREGIFLDAWDPREIIRLSLASARFLVIPTLTFWGLLAVGLPVYGFAIFIAFWVMLAYGTVLFTSLGPDRMPSF